MKKNLLLLAAFAFLLALPSATFAALPDVGGNPVNVTKCTQVGNDIQVTQNGNTYDLTTACRQTEYGYKFYTMKCTSDTGYYVNWKPCTSDEIVAVTKTSCAEGDNGLDYFKTSWSNGVIEGSTSMATVNDSCGNSIGDLNQEKGPWVAERNCSNGYVHTQWYKCENGCVNGACLKEPAIDPVTTPTCSENDNGLNYNVYGAASGQAENGLSSGTFTDSCGDYVGDSGKNEGAYIDEKNCSYGKVHSQWSKCDYGCFAGACKAKPAPAPVTKCSETDAFNYNVFGKTTGNDEVTGVYGTYGDSCGMYVGDKNKSSGSFIAETHCSSAGVKNYVHTQWYKCENGCVNGACQSKPVAEDDQNKFDLNAKTVITNPTNKTVLTNYPRVADLAWYKIDNANQYQVEVACDTCGHTPWSSIAKWKTYANNFQTPALWGDNEFRARILPVFPNGLTGQWSDYSYFSFKTTPTTNTAFSLPTCSDIKGGNTNFIVCAGFSVDHFWSGSRVKVISHDGETANVELGSLSEVDADLVLNIPETI